MVTMDKLDEIGKRLRQSTITTISLQNLSKLLQESTNSIMPKTIRNYIKILNQRGYIEFDNGLWKVKR